MRIIFLAQLDPLMIVIVASTVQYIFDITVVFALFSGIIDYAMLVNMIIGEKLIVQKITNEPPSKVGDVVYIPQRKRISVHKVTSIIIGVNNILCIEATPIIGYLVPCFFIDDIGNKVFLTEEEAEQALKERES